MVRTSSIILGALVSVGYVATAACGTSSSDCAETKTCTGADGTVDGGGDETGDAATDSVPPGCDPTADPQTAPKCVDDQFAIFVDASGGADTNDGSKSSPVKTIAKALEKVSLSKARIYLCAGDYAESIKLTSAVSIYGGFSCVNYASGGPPANIVPKDGGYGLTVSGVDGEVVISDVAVSVQAGTSQTRSSVAAFVSNSKGVTLRRTNLTAKDGYSGADAPDPVQGTQTPADGNGRTGDALNGGAEWVCTCSNGGSSKGGKGGDTGGVDPDGHPGETAQASPSPPNATGAPSTRTACENTGTVGIVGSDAPPANDASKPSIGTVDVDGWHPGDGMAGANGKPGQGGGGGGSYTKGAPAVNGGGGGGGCGGCGGTGGGGGQAGGASIALLVFNSTVHHEKGTLTAGNGGNGGRGRPGLPGLAGAAKGNGFNNACAGGPGGTGGHGGAGAGGSAGVSAGIAFIGRKPDLDPGTMVNKGNAGTAGTGGNGNDGASAQAADALEVQ